jgi:hypothetical protein
MFDESYMLYKTFIHSTISGTAMYVEALPQPPPLRIVNNRANSGTLSLNVMNRGIHGSINTTATELEQDQKLLATQRKVCIYTTIYIHTHAVHIFAKSCYIVLHIATLAL